MSAEAVDRLVMIIWDGCERTRVKRLMAEGLLPNLSALAVQGSIVGLEAGPRTCTKPNHAIILTGYGPNATKVKDNATWEVVPEGLSIPERLTERLGGQQAFSTYWTAGKPSNVGADEGKVFQAARRYCVHYRPDLYQPMEHTTRSAVKWITLYGHMPGFWFIHYRDPDATGHVYGEGSLEYSQAVIGLDTCLGEILAVCPSDMAVMVLADHGFDTGGPHGVNDAGLPGYRHGYAPKSWLCCNRPLARGGNLLDVAPTVYDLYGIDPASFTPPLLGESLLQPRPEWDPDEQPKPGYEL